MSLFLSDIKLLQIYKKYILLGGKDKIYHYFNLYRKHSQKVVRGAARDMWLSAAGCRIKDQEIIIHILVHLHDTCLVGASVTVVRCREDSDDVLIVTPIEPIHDELMCARNKL